MLRGFFQEERLHLSNIFQSTLKEKGNVSLIFFSFQTHCGSHCKVITEANQLMYFTKTRRLSPPHAYNMALTFLSADRHQILSLEQSMGCKILWNLLSWTEHHTDEENLRHQTCHVLSSLILFLFSLQSQPESLLFILK